MQVKQIREIIKELHAENSSPTISEKAKATNIKLITLYNNKISKVAEKTYKKFWL